jgi:uncharacterized protein (DUF736 family)
MIIGVLWKKVNDEGRDYLIGKIQSPFLPNGEMQIAVFQNKEMTTEKSPDYNIYWKNNKEE